MLKGDQSMNILIKNCNLISMAENREKYESNMDIYINYKINYKMQKIKYACQAL